MRTTTHRSKSHRLESQRERISIYNESCVANILVEPIKTNLLKFLKHTSCKSGKFRTYFYS